MNWITDTIAIGNREEGHDAGLLRRESFNSILSLVRRRPSDTPDEFGVKRIEVVSLKVLPVIDARSNDLPMFLRAVAMLEELASAAAPVFVHCNAGQSRSVIVVAGFLMKSLGIKADEALAQVKAKRESLVEPELERILDYIG